MLKQISVTMKDEPGALASFVKMINENGIKIRAITVSQIPGLVLFIVDKNDECVELLKKEAYEFTVKEVIAVLLPDNPTSSAEIQKVAEILGDKGVNIDFLYNSFINKTNYLIIHVSDVQKTTEVFKAAGIYLYDKDRF